MFEWLKRVVRRKRKVFLILAIGELYLSTAYESDAGFIAYWYNSPVILLGDGKATGHHVVKGWLPHKGWSPEDLNGMVKIGK